MSFEGFPLIMGWELTLACNLRCNHCASSAGKARDNELTTEESLKICDQFPALLVREVDFTGGEPLLRPDWPEIAMYLKDLGITTKILTNGIALNARIVSKIKEVGISGVGVSLDGLEHTHDQIRGYPGSFSHVMKSIDLLLDENISLTIITTVSNMNIDELPEIHDMLGSKGVKRWRVQPLIPFGRGSKGLNLNEYDYLKLEDFVHRWGPDPGDRGVELICSDGLAYFDKTDLIDLPWLGCSAGITSCGIASDGKIKGCLSLPDELIEGDLRKKDLWDIWFHPDSFAYTRQFSADKIGSNCSSCGKVLECKGGCSAKSYAYSGQFNNDPYCIHGIGIRKQQLSSEVIPKVIKNNSPV